MSSRTSNWLVGSAIGVLVLYLKQDIWESLRKVFYRIVGKKVNYNNWLRLKRATCIIKLGGSACTFKHAYEAYNDENVKKFSQQLSKICEEDSSYRPIVIHGAGSFGHFQAKSFSINDGAISATGKPSNSSEIISSFLREGFIKTRISVTGLNHRVVSTMTALGVPAVGISPFPYIPIEYRKLQNTNFFSTFTDWKWNKCFNYSMSASLTMGLVPVLHGDACIDVSEKITGILSGDTIFMYLCEVFKPTHAVFLTDVNGVYTSPPSSPGSDLINEILVDSRGKWKISTATGSSVLDENGIWQKCDTSIVPSSYDSITNTPCLVTSVASHDVTGGIDGKLQSAYDTCTKHNIPIYIVGVGTPDAVLAMKGQVPDSGTTIRYQERT